MGSDVAAAMAKVDVRNFGALLGIVFLGNQSYSLLFGCVTLVGTR